MGNDQLGCLPNLLFDLSSWDTSLTRSHSFPIRSILSHPPSTSPFGEIHWESKQPTVREITWKGRKNLLLGKDPWTSKHPLKRTTKVNHHFILTAILTGHSDLELQYVSPVAMPPPEVVQLCQRKRALRGTIANGLFMSVGVSKQKSINQQIWETKVDLKSHLQEVVSNFYGLLKLFYKMRFPICTLTSWASHHSQNRNTILPFTNDNNPQVLRKNCKKTTNMYINVNFLFIEKQKDIIISTQTTLVTCFCFETKSQVRCGSPPPPRVLHGIATIGIHFL